MRIFVFHRHRLDPRALPWQQHSRCHILFRLWCVSLEIFLMQCFTVLSSLNTSFLPEYLGHVSSNSISSLLISLTTVWWFCVNFWVVLGNFGKEINFFFFWKDWLNWGRYEMLKIYWIWKIEIWSEESSRWTPNSLLPTWGSILRGQLSGSVSNTF